MNVTAVDSADSGGFSQQEMALVGIIVSVVIQLIMCVERGFSRVSKSSCRRDATGAISMEVESKEKV